MRDYEYKVVYVGKLVVLKQQWHAAAEAIRGPHECCSNKIRPDAFRFFSFLNPVNISC